MPEKRTFTMIKPSTVAEGLAGAILAKILEAGFRIISLKMILMTDNKPVNFMRSIKNAHFIMISWTLCHQGLLLLPFLRKTMQ